MAGNDLLGRAEKLFRRGLYAEALAVADRSAAAGEELQRLRAVCCLYLGEFARARAELRLLKSLRPDDEAALLGLGYLDLLEGRDVEALSHYTTLVRTGREAAPVTALLHEMRAVEDLQFWARAKNPDAFLFGVHFPGSPARLARRRRARRAFLLFVVLFSVAAAGAAAYWLPRSRWIRDLRTKDVFVKEPADTKTLAKQQRMDRLKKVYLFDLPEDRGLATAEVLALFEDTKKAIASGDVNRAQRHVNRILTSDANLLLKEKFRILESAIPPPALGEFEENRSFGALVADPLGVKCWVKLRGRAGGVQEPGGRTLFDLTFNDPRSANNETWTVDCAVDSTGLGLKKGKDYVVLGRYLGMDGATRRAKIEVSVMKEFLE